MFLGGWMVKKIGPRWTTLIGGLTMSLGVLLSYFTIKVSFWLLLLTYGLLFGVGVGLAYVGPLTAAMKWLPKWKGFANGIVVAGFGLGALIFNIVQTTYVNPENKAHKEGNSKEEYFTNPELIDRVPFLFLILGGTYAVMQLVGSLLIIYPPEEFTSENTPQDRPQEVAQSGHYREVDDDSTSRTKSVTSTLINAKRKLSTHSDPEKRPSSPMNGFVNEQSVEVPESNNEKDKLIRNGSSSPAYSDSGRGNTPERNLDLDAESSITSSATWSHNVVTSLKPLQMLKKTSFYILWCMFLTNGLVVMFIATLYKFIGLQMNFDDHFLAIMGSVAAIFNCLGRIIWGNVADRVSYKFALVLIGGIMTIFLLTLYISTLSTLGIAGSKAMFFIWICIIFFCIGGNFSVFPTAIARAFGVQYVPVNYGLLFTSQIIAGSMGAFLATILKVHLGISGLLFLISGFSALGFILAFVYRPKRYISLQPN